MRCYLAPHCSDDPLSLEGLCIKQIRLVQQGPACNVDLWSTRVADFSR